MDLIPTTDQGLKLLGIFSKNRMEWCIAENACHAFGAADVALYDTLGEEAMAFIVQLCQLKTIATTADGAKQLTEMKKNKPEEMKTLKAIIQFVSTKGRIMGLSMKQTNKELIFIQDEIRSVKAAKSTLDVLLGIGENLKK
jgi:long-subunit acyl-CoA synthetase (AMP-forming)